MAIERIIRSEPAIQYDGTNSAEILAAGSPVSPGTLSIESEVGGVLVLRDQEEGPNFHTLNTGDWLSLSQFGPVVGAEVTRLADA